MVRGAEALLSTCQKQVELKKKTDGSRKREEKCQKIKINAKNVGGSEHLISVFCQSCCVWFTVDKLF